MVIQGLEVKLNVVEGSLVAKNGEMDEMKKRLEEYVAGKELQQQDLREALRKFEETWRSTRRK